MIGFQSNKIGGAGKLLFLIGLFSQTQVHLVGSIGISELFIFIVAPFMFAVDYKLLKNDGFLTFIWLIITVCVGCVISCIYNETPFILAAKGFATPYAIFAITIVLHRLLRNNFMLIKWLFIGIFLSMIISTFIFQPETYTFSGGEVATGGAAVERMMSYPLYWALRIIALVTLPIKCMYLKTPFFYSVGITFLGGIFAIVASDSSGRATAMISIFSVILLCFGGKKQKTLAKLGRNFPFILLLMLLAGLIGKFAYSVAAQNGKLGDKAIDKYEKQTSQGAGVLDILMSGRKEFFIGIRAALDKPILGHGPKAEDTKGYYLEYLSKYGTWEDYEFARRERLNSSKLGYNYFIIPTHSFLASFWVYYGVMGLIFWIYNLWLVWKYFRKYASAIPQWFGYLSYYLPTMVWGVFFAPFGDRLGQLLPFICILFAKAIYERRIVLPPDMQIEILKNNNK